MPILVFPGLSVLDLGPMYATDIRRQTNAKQTDVRQHHRLMPRKLGAGASNAACVQTLHDTIHCLTADEHFGACSGDAVADVEDQPRPEVDSGRSR